ncbi:hypothetical protein JTE90_006463 [Oedothorax gibbosus]|uniref:Uncharacterized protein n=1 Tax=Oedothorax gibbosus TaxID=931172 RepID=A0AAV6UHW1_9ARAC|nr:hypothetical protein JTE90_006463 [Oedothorax gibbosus]
MRTSNPTAKRIVCMKKFVCHQSAYHKLTPETNKRGNSKNSGCLAIIRIKVKHTTRSTIKADPFVKNGLPAVITIKDQHNHNLNAAETLRCLPADVCREKFIEYFNNGMKVSTALQHHRELLKQRYDISEEDMTNSRINPTNRTVSHWFWKWRMGKYKPKETKVNDHSKVDIFEQQLGNEKSKEMEHGKDFESSDINQQGLNIQYIIQAPYQYLNKIPIPRLPSKRKHWITDHRKRKLLKKPEPVKILPANSPEKKIEIESVFSLDQFVNKQNTLNTLYLPQPTMDPILQANNPSPVIKFKDKTDEALHKVDQVINRQDIPRLTVIFLPPPTVVLSPVIRIREDGFCKVGQAVSRNDILNTLYLPKPTVDQNLQENSPSPVTKIKEEKEEVCKVDQVINGQDLLQNLYVPPATVDPNLQANSSSPATLSKEEIEDI